MIKRPKEKYKFEVGQTYKTTGGYDATILMDDYYDRSGGLSSHKTPILACVKYTDHTGRKYDMLVAYDQCGWCPYGVASSIAEKLYLVPKKHVVYVVRYTTPTWNEPQHCVFKTAEKANRYVNEMVSKAVVPSMTGIRYSITEVELDPLQDLQEVK